MKSILTYNNETVKHIYIYQCKCNNRAYKIQVFFYMSTNKFGKRICKLLVESNRETFIGYVLGATDDLLIYAISAELYLDILIFCSHVLLPTFRKAMNTS